MTENVIGNAVIKASVDSTGVESGVERVGKSLDGMAVTRSICVTILRVV
jgi:hypothetical protein